MRSGKFWALALVCIMLVGCGISLVPSKDEWYGKHYYIMQDYEWKIYKSLSAAGQLEFQKLFWEARSPGSKKEFDQRVEYCMQTFKRENSKQPFNVDRAHIYLLNGRPDQIEYSQNDTWANHNQSGAANFMSVNDRTNEDVSANTAEVWTYQYDKFLIQYVFVFQSPSTWKMNQAVFSGNRYVGAFELQNKEDFYGPANEDDYKAKLEELKKIK